MQRTAMDVPEKNGDRKGKCAECEQNCKICKNASFVSNLCESGPWCHLKLILLTSVMHEMSFFTIYKYTIYQRNKKDT